ncbi:glutathione S-transferase family protein [Natronospira bacteriovora]|uniref:Glutathione S-transferase family protein n=1 Tax=Natronospira bacteriovora TaxID=3069753 RepID=A0ABU0W4Z7_9GAMM|nr:glutathione S-transferase family protein [Natronospira sp. AB-CW4]MDQ2069093.1 glutathione S-transferase family protein [Natronospira sp. AB-CW4]
MGLLVDGKWVDQWYDTEKHGGRFVRESAQFRNWITADGRAGPDGEGGFKAEANRYHLYVSYACPWAHRTLIFRKLKKLEDVISVSPVDPDMLENGWEFGDRNDGTHDPLFGYDCLHQVYTRAAADYTGRVTVPVVWDKQRETIVSNESAEIIRMLNSEFDAFTDVKTDFYPQALRKDIDAINEVVYHQVNNGVYRCGFATAQDAYDEAFDALFRALDELEQRLSRQRYLVGEQITEADWRLFTTLMRFDPVYVGHFKTNLRRIADYPNLLNYTRELYQVPGVAETVNMRHIKRHYYYSHGNINPTRIVPRGPELDLEAPHDRDRF